MVSQKFKSQLKAEIAARRDNRLFGGLAKAAEKYLRAYNNQCNWDMRCNGETHALRLVTENCDGDVLDVGANEGQWASAALAVIGGRRLHCFELAPRPFERLRANFGNAPNIALNDFGLGAKSDRFDFYFCPCSSDRSSRYRIDDGFAKEQITVSVIPGDEYVTRNRISQISFLKLDVEGMEMEVLQGFDCSLRAGIIRAVQFEHGPAHVLARKLLFDFLQLFASYQYSVFRVFPKALAPVRYSVENDESFVGENFVAIDQQLISRLPLRPR